MKIMIIITMEKCSKMAVVTCYTYAALIRRSMRTLTQTNLKKRELKMLKIRKRKVLIKGRKMMGQLNFHCIEQEK